MQYLPIVERELRVAARQSRTWWRRVLTVGVALVVFGFVYFGYGRYASVSRVGGVLFTVMGGFGMVYGLLAGPLATADCVSRERRDRTLGLLFLTDLHSYDVVLGKVGAASLDFVLSLLAAMPVVAIPVLMGGVSAAQFTHISLALLDMMFLSLAIGVCASSFWQSGRAALAVTVLFLFLLTLGWPWFVEQALGVGISRRAAPWLYLACPLYTMKLTLANSSRAAPWEYWLNLGGMHALAWACLGLACWRTRNSWRELPPSRLALRWRRLLESWDHGSLRFRLGWRGAMLERNPVAWLEGRNRLERRVLWGLCLGSAIFWAGSHLHAPQAWPDGDWLILWPAFAHYIFCLWVAIQAPRRFADDKQSGALELLLCTPLAAREVVGGAMSSLRTRFGRALLALLLLDAFIVYAYYSSRGGWAEFTRGEDCWLASSVLAVFPLQGWSFACVGLYQGLARANSLRATFTLVWRIGLLPWVLFIAFILIFEVCRQRFRSFPHLNDKEIFTAWAGFHVLVCGCFLAHAAWQLHGRFRDLAAQTVVPPWWLRGWRFIRRG